MVPKTRQCTTAASHATLPGINRGSALYGLLLQFVPRQAFFFCFLILILVLIALILITIY